MEFAARQFAKRVLLAHLALLLLVLLAVGMAAKYLYAGARQQVIAQNGQMQKLLAVQTASGIDHYYESIINVLNLLDPNEMPAPATQPGRRPPPQPARLPPQQLPGRRNNVDTRFKSAGFERIAAGVWDQIRDKCSMMFFVDALDGFRMIGLTGKSPGELPEEVSTAGEVIKQASPWLAEINAAQKKSISPFYPGISGGAHLVCVPRPNGVLLVAVVPIENVEQNLLDIVNRSALTGSMLVDNQGTFVSSSFPGVRGKKVDDLSDPHIRAMAQATLAAQDPKGSTKVFDKPGKIGEAQLKPSMTTIEPVKVLGNKTWFVIISSSLDEVDNLVQPIFRDALVWAIVVMVAVMAILASTAIQMIRSRLRLERAQMELMNRELAQARQIQLNWLPEQPCTIRGVEICAVNTPATQISGDFYNWFELPDGRIAIVVGDVTGHGMSAAFLMATTQLLVRTNLPRVCDPGFCMEEVNRQLCTQIFSGQFVTMLILVIDPANGHLDLATAGHPAPLICENGTATALKIEPQLVLGVDPATEYPTQRFDLTPHAGLLLYTDGVPDAIAPGGGRFQLGRLLASLKHTSASAKQMLDSVMDSIESFRTGRDLSDDLTLVAVRVEAVGTRVPQTAVAAAADQD